MNSVRSALSSFQSMFCGVGQKLSPLDSNVSSSLVRGEVERFRTVLVSSGCVLCIKNKFFPFLFPFQLFF